VADDDRALRERLAALEAEVQADADAQRARKAAALAKLRDQRVTQTAGGAPVVRNRALPGDEPARHRRVAERSDPEIGEDDHRRGADPLEDLGGGAGKIDIDKVSSGLKIAFYTTILALLLSAILVLLQNIVQRKEEGALNRAAQYCLKNLINRVYTGK